MNNHTPEPWHGKRIGIAVHYFESIGVEISLTGKSNEAMANSRRIVACVNACRGLSTDELELRGLVSAVGTELMALDKQRDELLAALEELAQSGLEFASVDEVEDREDAGTIESNFNDALISARRAIAAAKGGASC